MTGSSASGVTVIPSLIHTSTSLTQSCQYVQVLGGIPVLTSLASFATTFSFQADVSRNYFASFTFGSSDNWFLGPLLASFNW